MFEENVVLQQRWGMYFYEDEEFRVWVFIVLS